MPKPAWAVYYRHPEHLIPTKFRNYAKSTSLAFSKLANMLTYFLFHLCLATIFRNASIFSFYYVDFQYAFLVCMQRGLHVKYNVQQSYPGGRPCVYNNTLCKLPSPLGYLLTFKSKQIQYRGMEAKHYAMHSVNYCIYCTIMQILVQYMITI